MLERTALEGGITALIDSELRDLGFLVAFTERGGGESEGPFRSLNLGLGSGDDPASVAANRRRVCRALRIPTFATGQQVHGARCVRLGPPQRGAGFDDRRQAVPGADALVASTRGMAIAVVVADCVPVVLVDPSAGTVAVVHAGWRGVATGVMDAALRAFQGPGPVRAVIGPAIGPDHYEVGPEVVSAVGAASSAGPVIAPSEAGHRLDLAGTVERILEERGVAAVERDATCTACEPDRFFSHRRDGRTGRQALIAGRL